MSSKHTRGPFKPGRRDMLNWRHEGEHPEKYGKTIYLDRENDRARYHPTLGERLPIAVGAACYAISESEKALAQAEGESEVTP